VVADLPMDRRIQGRFGVWIPEILAG